MVQSNWYTVDVHSRYEHSVVCSALMQAPVSACGLPFVWAQARDIDWTSVLEGQSLASACPLFYGTSYLLDAFSWHFGDVHAAV